MDDRTNTIIATLRTLLQLTQTESQVATTRRAQARSEAVERELAENARMAEERTGLIQDGLRSLGGVPDVVTPVLGRLTAVAKAGVEQAQPLTEALFGDLALEHQLLDRSRYLRALAQAADEPGIGRLSDRLIAAHTETVEWLTTVLAEEALGGPPAVGPTPIQAVVSGSTRLAYLPARWTAERVNRTVAQLRLVGQQTGTVAAGAAQTAGQLREALGEVFVSGRDASLATAERVADREGAGDTAESVHEVRRDLGALHASELPIEHYDDLGSSAVTAAVRKLNDAAELRAVIAYEAAHKARRGVAAAAEARLATVAAEAVAIS